MKKPDFKTGWKSALRWKGWKTAADFFMQIWNCTSRWPGWRVFFGLPLSLLLVLCLGCTAALIWVFAHQRTQWVPAYFLYALSAYALSAVCVKIPVLIGKGKCWFSHHPKLKAFLRNKELHFRLGLYLDQIINFAYGSFKIVYGVILGSAWIGCDGIYNMAQALIQLFQILWRKHAKTQLQQWKSYKVCGLLILLMHLTLVGTVFQMVNWNRAVERGEIMVIATAFFAFYKVITGFIRIAKDRKHLHPVDSSIRMLNLAQSFFAIFSLQASMLHTFGTGESWEHLMNILTGCAVCLLILSIGFYMIHRGNREMKYLQEINNGK